MKGGPGRVSRAMKKSGIDDFWRLTATTKYLPRETREYVPLIMAAMIVGRNPAQYGFEAVTADPLVYDKVMIPQAIDLRRVHTTQAPRLTPRHGIHHMFSRQPLEHDRWPRRQHELATRRHQFAQEGGG